MKKALISIAFCVFLAMAASSVSAYQALIGKSEVVYYDPMKSYGGYTLFAPISGLFAPYASSSFLIDIKGNVVHTWPVAYWNPQFLDNGHLLGYVTSMSPDSPMGMACMLQEVDWDGNVIWEYAPTREDLAGQHHDFVRIYNNDRDEYTTLALCWIKVSYEEAIANGADPECNISEDTFSTPEAILEIDMNGNIVWEWSFWDHAIQNYDSTKGKYGDPKAPENYGKLDMNVDTNTTTGLGPDWNHLNSIDYNPYLDQICFNSREHGEFYVIDHSITTEEAAGPAGDFVFRWGNPANYNSEALVPTFNGIGHEQIYGAHDIHWIDATAYTGGPALPGAGNFLIFENGCFRPGFVQSSYIFEINPYDGPMENGIYIKQMDGGHTPTQGMGGVGFWSNQIVWDYSGFSHGFAQQKGFYSTHISGTGRLPNGNTIMCAGQDGNFIEVTNDKALAWQYISPIVGTTAKPYIEPGDSNSVFRCYRYGPDHPVLAGRDLTPMGTIVERAGVESLQDKLEALMAQ